MIVCVHSPLHGGPPTGWVVEETYVDAGAREERTRTDFSGAKNKKITPPAGGRGGGKKVASLLLMEPRKLEPLQAS